jgi:hypothetical protein
MIGPARQLRAGRLLAQDLPHFGAAAQVQARRAAFRQQPAEIDHMAHARRTRRVGEHLRRCADRARRSPHPTASNAQGSRRPPHPLQRAAHGVGVAHIALAHLHLLAPRARRQPVCVPRQHAHAVAPLQQARRQTPPNIARCTRQHDSHSGIILNA